MSQAQAAGAPREVHSIVVPAEVYGAVLQYLNSRPHGEVGGIAHAFSTQVQARFLDDVLAQSAADSAAADAAANAAEFVGSSQAEEAAAVEDAAPAHESP